MIERIYILESVDPVIFYGVNNTNMQLIKTLFPKLRIVARGNVMKVIGDEEESEVFLKKIREIERYCEEFNQKENSVELGEFKIENPLGRFDLIIVSKRNWLLYDAKIPWNQIYYRATNKVLKYCFNGRSNSDIINAFKIALKDISK